MDTVEEAWKNARILNRLPDTPQMREAFYHGARHAMTAMLDAAEDDDAAYALNDQLHDFAKDILATT